MKKLILIFAVCIVAGCKKTPPKEDPKPSDTYTVTATAGPNGAITPSGTTVVPAGQTEIYTVNPNSGYIATVAVDNSAPTVVSGNTYPYSTTSGHHDINFAFVKKVTVTVTVGPNGTATPMTQQVIEKSNVTVTFFPNQGFHVDSIWVNNIFTQIGGATYTFSVNQDSTVVVKVSFTDALTKDELAAKSSLLDGAAWHLVQQEQSIASIGPFGDPSYLHWTGKAIASCKDHVVYGTDKSFVSYLNGTSCTGAGGPTNIDISATWSFSPNGTKLFLTGKQYTTPTAYTDYSSNFVVDKLTADSLVLTTPAIFTGAVVATRSHYAHH